MAVSPVDITNPLLSVARQLNTQVPLPFCLNTQCILTFIYTKTQLFRYSEDFEGIPLSYTKCKMIKGKRTRISSYLSSLSTSFSLPTVLLKALLFTIGKEHGKIIDELPWIYVDITTKMIVFRPFIGQTLRGKANKVINNKTILFISS